MPRANRHYIPGCSRHITHRCHKQEFLLKFAHDRRRYQRLEPFELFKRFCRSKSGASIRGTQRLPAAEQFENLLPVQALQQ